MTKLDKPLRRLVDVAGGKQVVVELVPADEGIPAHIKFRVPGAQRSFFTKYIEVPSGTPFPVANTTHPAYPTAAGRPPVTGYSE